MHIVEYVGGDTGYKVSSGGRVVMTTTYAVEAYAYAAGEDRRALNKWFWKREEETAEILQKAIDWFHNYQENLESLIVILGEESDVAMQYVRDRVAALEKLDGLNARLDAIEAARNTNDANPAP